MNINQALFGAATLLFVVALAITLWVSDYLNVRDAWLCAGFAVFAVAHIAWRRA